MTESYTFATVKAVETTDGPGEFEAILSTSTLDRDGEVIAAKAFDPLPASIPIYFEHDWKSGSQPIGRGIPYYDGDDVKVKGTYASTPRAQEIRTLVAEGMVDSMSVGFLNGKRESKSGVRTVTSGEVFEGSLTAIPINTTARILAAKAFAEKAGARNSTTDATRLQSIHDLAVENGAACMGAKSIKAVAGSLEQRSEELYEALTTAYADADWVETIATFDDHVIVEVHGGTADDQQFSIPYTFDGDEVTLGAAEAVEAVESLTVTPASGSAAASTDTAAADAAAKSVEAAAPDPDALAAKFRLHQFALAD